MRPSEYPGGTGGNHRDVCCRADRIRDAGTDADTDERVCADGADSAFRHDERAGRRDKDDDRSCRADDKSACVRDRRGENDDGVCRTDGDKSARVRQNNGCGQAGRNHDDESGFDNHHNRDDHDDESGADRDADRADETVGGNVRYDRRAGSDGA